MGPEDGVSWSHKPIPYQVYVVAKRDAESQSKGIGVLKEREGC